MAWSLVGTAAAASQGAASAAVTPAWGTSQNRTANNLLICQVSGTAVATLPTTPSGWTIAKQQAGTSCSSTIYYKVAAGADAAPTIAAVTSAVWSVQLAEYTGGTSNLPLDKTGGTASVSSPNTATNTAADAGPGDLVIGCWAEYRSMTATSTYTVAYNNGATATNVSNTGTSTQSHYGFSYGVTTGNASADTYSVSGFSTSQLTGTATALASFRLPPTGAVSLSATAGLSAGPPVPKLVSAGSVFVNSGGLRPTFGQPTTAGNLLVCMIANPSGALPACSSNPNGAWKPATGSNNSAIVWYRQNCLANEPAPQFSGGSTSNVAQLMEFSGVPQHGMIVEQAIQGGSSVSSPATATLPAVAGQPVNLLLACAVNAFGSPGSTQTMTLNNATAVATASAPAALPAYWFGYGIPPSNPSADQATLTWTGGTAPLATVSLVSIVPGTVPSLGSTLVSMGGGTFASGTLSASFGGITTAGNLLVAALSLSAGATVTCSTNPNGAWVRAGSVSDNSAQVWYRPNCLASESVPVFTISGSGTIQMFEFEQVATTSPVDQVASGGPVAGSGPLNVALPSTDTYPYEAMVFAGSLQGTGLSSPTVSFNHGMVYMGANSATTPAPGFAFAISTTNTSVDSAQMSWGGGTNPAGSGVLVSFLAQPSGPPVQRGSAFGWDQWLTGDDAEFEGGIGGWTVQSGCTIASSTDVANAGTHSLKVTATSTAGAFFNSKLIPVSLVSTTQFSAQIFFRTASTSRSCYVSITAYDSGMNYVTSVGGGTANDTTTGWTASSGSLQIPPNAAWIQVTGNILQPLVANEVHYIDSVSLYTFPGANSTLTVGATVIPPVLGFISMGATTGMTVTATTAPPPAIHIVQANTSTTFGFNPYCICTLPNPLSTGTKIFCAAILYDRGTDGWASVPTWSAGFDTSGAASNPTVIVADSAFRSSTGVPPVQTVPGARFTVWMGDIVASLVGTTPNWILGNSGTPSLTMVLLEIAGLPAGNSAQIDGTPGVTWGNAGTTPGLASYASSKVGEMLLNLYGSAEGGETWTVPSGYTDVIDVPGTNNGQGYGNVGIGQKSSTGTTETGTFSVTNNNSQWFSIVMALVGGGTGGGPATVTGSAALSGSAGMTVAGTTAPTGAVTMAGTAGMTVQGTRVVPATVTTLAPTTTMTVTPSVSTTSTVLLTGSTTMTVPGVRTVPGVAPLSATAGISVGATATYFGSVNLSGTAGLTAIPASGGALVTGAANLAATAGMTMLASVTEVASVVESATAGMTITPSVTTTSSVNQSATAGLTVAASVTTGTAITEAAVTGMTVAASTATITGQVSMSGTAALTTFAGGGVTGTVTLSGTAGMTVAAGVTRQGIAPLAATAGLTVAASVATTASVNESAVTSLTVLGTVQKFGAVAMAATTTLSGLPLPATITGQVSMSASATLVTITGGTLVTGQVAMASTGALSVVATVVAPVTGQVSMAGTGAMTVGAGVSRAGAVAMVATAGFSATGFLPSTVQGQVNMTSAGGLSVSASSGLFTSVTMAAVASLMVTAYATVGVAPSFSAVTSMAVTASSTTTHAQVRMAGTSGMHVVADVTRVAPSLADQIAALAGQDPLMVGATGYMDDIFTTRLLGDSE